jgi:hypothetical protein
MFDWFQGLCFCLRALYETHPLCGITDTTSLDRVTTDEFLLA